MKHTAVLLLLLLGSQVFAGDTETRFPLLGLWRVTVSKTADGQPLAEGEQMEMEFLPDGILLITAISPSKGVTTPVRLRFHYSFHPPDVVIYSLTGDPVERQRFKISGDTATFDHLDYKTHAELRRIKKTEFEEPPRDINDFPH